jgi:hypothetical protein
MHFLSGGNVRESAYTGRANDFGPLHLAIENIAMEGLQAAEIYLDRAPSILLLQSGKAAL